MSSTFAGLQLFDSGPHRFMLTHVGRAVAPPRREMNVTNFTENYAVRELEIEQHGRLVADKIETLSGIIESIRMHAELGTRGVLVDTQGMTYQDMTLVGFTMREPIAVGRMLSVRYSVRYIRLGQGGSP